MSPSISPPVSVPLHLYICCLFSLLSPSTPPPSHTHFLSLIYFDLQQGDRLKVFALTCGMMYACVCVCAFACVRLCVCMHAMVCGRVCVCGFWMHAVVCVHERICVCVRARSCVRACLQPSPNNLVFINTPVVGCLKADDHQADNRARCPSSVSSLPDQMR